MHCYECCDDDCPFRSLAFSSTICQVAEETLSAVLWNLGIAQTARSSFSIFMLRHSPSLMDIALERSVEWVDGELDCCGYVIIEWNRPQPRGFADSMLKSICDSLRFSLFPTRRWKASLKQYSASLHLLLWVLVECLDWINLQDVLDKASDVLPKCVKLSLLLKCIRFGEEEGVRVLLNAGAKAFAQSCQKGIRHPMYMTVGLISRCARTRKSPKDPSAMFFIYTQILEKLINHGTRYEISPESKHPFAYSQEDSFLGTNFSTLAFVADVAGFNGETAYHLIELASKFLNETLVSNFNPILLTIQNLRFAIHDIPESYSQTQVYAMFNEATLALVRAGALLDSRDLEMRRKLNENLTQIVSAWPFQDLLLDCLTRLVIECQVLPDCLYQVTLQFDDSILQTLINSCFPRRLSSICRQVILCRLPLGVAKRRSAIRSLTTRLKISLDEKYRLSSFLSMKDLEIPSVQDLFVPSFSSDSVIC